MSTVAFLPFRIISSPSRCNVRQVASLRNLRSYTLSMCSVTPRARFRAERFESIDVQQFERPLLDYMRLPASQYSVLDAERIERVDDNTFRCYVYKVNFFNFEVCPVLLVRVDEEPFGCSINLLSCELQVEGSPRDESQVEKFSASMVNKISCDPGLTGATETTTATQQLSSDTMIEVSLDIPSPLGLIPMNVIEAAGCGILNQILKMMVPRFLAQLVKDYKAWASGDSSRKPLGTGEI